MSKFIFNYRNLNNYYKFILYSSIFLVIFIFFFCLSIFSKEIYLKNIFHSKEDEPIGYRQSFIRQIFCFLITLFLSFIFCKFEKKRTRESYTLSNGIDKASISQRSLSEIELIHQESESINYSNSFFLNLLSIVLLWVIIDNFIDKNIINLQYSNFWMFELIFLSLFYKKLFNVKIYIHQSIAMILNIIPFLLKLVVIILSFYDNYFKNIYDKLRWPLIILLFVFYLLLILLKSFIYTKIKWYMDIKYISFTKILIYYGLIGTIFQSIISIISTFNDCEITYNSTKNIFDFLCENKITNIETNETIKYLANFKLYFTSYKNIKELFLEIMTVFLGALGFFFYKYFSLMTIKYLSPIHLMLSNILLYIFSIIIIIVILIKNNILFNNNMTLTIIILNFIGDVLCLIIISIYLEILELNFCNLNFYLRKKIMERGLEDLYENDENDNLINEDDDEGNKKEKEKL